MHIPRASIDHGFRRDYGFSVRSLRYLAVKLVSVIDQIWAWLRAAYQLKTNPTPSRVAAAPAAAVPYSSAPAAVELIADPSRRYFFKTATALAGAAPFLTAVYGFAAERLDYQVRQVEIPLPNLPAALEGMKIVQISDIHLSSYMPRLQVRRAVNMANDLGADLALVTGDFITGAGDPIADCIEEVQRSPRPAGSLGLQRQSRNLCACGRYGSTPFRAGRNEIAPQENAKLTFKGASFNLIGVDYQRERTNGGRKVQLLQNVEPLVRRDMPNILNVAQSQLV